MTSRKLTLTLLFSAIFAGSASLASAVDLVIPTNKTGGSDVELREFSPTDRRGLQTELASRVRSNIPANLEPAVNSDRSSIMLVRFNIRGLTLADLAVATDVAYRTTFHSGNLPQSQPTFDPNGVQTGNSQGRLEYTWDPDYDPNTGALLPTNDTSNDGPRGDDDGDEETRTMGFNFYALSPGHPANNPGAGFYLESGPADNNNVVSYSNAPGILKDFDIGTFDVDPGQTVFLGNKKLPDIGTQNHLPVGSEFVFDDVALKTHVAAAIAAGDSFVNLLVHLDFDGNANFGQFVNHNYIVNPKEKLTLNNDNNYDFDVTNNSDPNNNNPNGNPLSGAANTGQFSPQLILRGVLTPEPSSFALLGLVGLGAMSTVRRRRK